MCQRQRTVIFWEGGRVLKEIGNWLRQEREARGLTHADLQAITKLRMHYIVALEDGNFDLLPGGVYTRAFVRTYALGMGVNPAPIMHRYDEICRNMQRSLAPLEMATPAVSGPRRLARGIWATFSGTLEWLGL